MEEIPDDAKLYRIVKTWGCPSGNISDLKESVFSAREEKELSLYLSTKDTPKEALKNYLTTSAHSDFLSEVSIRSRRKISC